MSYFDNRYREGLAAYKSGKSLEDNPNYKGTANYWQWSSGYRDGEAFHGEDDKRMEQLIEEENNRALKGQQHDK